MVLFVVTAFEDLQINADIAVGAGLVPAPHGNHKGKGNHKGCPYDIHLLY
jgi:hypothetical protein